MGVDVKDTVTCVADVTHIHCVTSIDHHRYCSKSTPRRTSYAIRERVAAGACATRAPYNGASDALQATALGVDVAHTFHEVLGTVCLAGLDLDVFWKL